MKSLTICANAFALQYPETIGLENVSLTGNPNIHVFSSAEDTRQWWRESQGKTPAWIVSCDDMEAVNLAAALKQDNAQGQVHLVMDHCPPAMQAAMASAGIDGTKSVDDLAAVLGSSAPNICPFPTAPGFDPDSESEPACQAIAGGRNLGKLPLAPRFDPDPTEEGTPDSLRGQHARVQEPGDAPNHAAQAPACAQATPQAGGIIIPVVSGSGGSGKSTIALMCALIAAKRGYKTALLDADLQFGDLHMALGQEHPVTLDDVMLDIQEVSRLRPKHQLPAIVASLRLPERADEAIEKMPAILEALQENFEVIIVNTGSFWTEEHAILLERCTKAFFMVDQRPSSLRSCRRALDICIHCGIATSPLLFVVNRCSKDALYSSIDVSCSLHGMASFEVKDGGQEVEELLAVGQAQNVFDLRNGFAASIEQLLQTALPLREGEEALAEEQPARRKPWGLFGHAPKAGEEL